VVHEVGHTRDRGGRERECLDEAGIRARRRRHRRPAGVLVEVVGEPDIDAARCSVRERTANDRGQRVRQPDVVDRDLECALRLRDPVREQVRDLLRRLAAVGERAELYRAAFARSSALCARFAA
jgi:hypothetical protein